MKIRKLSELKKLEDNPRFIRDNDFIKLCESIQNNKEYFNARPLILSDRTGELVILAGNQRYEAAKKIGLKQVPTYLIEGLTEEKEKEIIIRDNVSNGNWDFDILANLFDAKDLEDWGVDIPNFDDEINEEINDLSNDEKVTYKIELTFNSEIEQEKHYIELTEKGYSCQILTL